MKDLLGQALYCTFIYPSFMSIRWLDSSLTPRLIQRLSHQEAAILPVCFWEWGAHSSTRLMKYIHIMK